MIRALIVIAAFVGCAPTLDTTVPNDYLATAPAANPGRFGASDGAAHWLLLVGRLEPQWQPLCADRRCRLRGLVRAIHQAAARGADAAIVIDVDGTLLSQVEVVKAARQAHLVLLAGHDWTTADGIDLTLVESVDGATASSAAASAPAADWRAELERVHALGGIALLRRPCQQRAAVARLLADARLAELVTAVEVGGPALIDSTCDRGQWHVGLRQGQRWYAIGSSSALLSAGDLRLFNLVEVDERTPAALLRALAAGHSQLVFAARPRPRIEIGLTTDADGQLEELTAAQPVVVAGESVVVQLRTVGGRGAELLLYTEAAVAPVRRLAVDGNDVVAAFRYPVPTARVGFVRAELYRGGDVEVATAPVFFARAPAPETPARNAP